MIMVPNSKLKETKLALPTLSNPQYIEANTVVEFWEQD